MKATDRERAATQEDHRQTDRGKGVHRMNEILKNKEAEKTQRRTRTDTQRDGKIRLEGLHGGDIK